MRTLLYRIFFEADPDSLEDLVQQFLDEGWSVCGNLVVTGVSSGGDYRLFFTQAMTKVSEG